MKYSKHLILLAFSISITTLLLAQDTIICQKYNTHTATLALHKKKPQLVIMGGIVRAIKPSDLKFAKKYKIEFLDTGCEVEDQTCIKAFNQVTIHYLDKKYGKAWRKYIRKNIIGL